MPAPNHRRAQGHLRFDQVGFGYPGTDRTALTDIVLDIQPGETVALVGSSGGGKSTLMSLIRAFTSPAKVASCSAASTSAIEAQ